MDCNQCYKLPMIAGENEKRKKPAADRGTKSTGTTKGADKSHNFNYAKKGGNYYTPKGHSKGFGKSSWGREKGKYPSLL